MPRELILWLPSQVRFQILDEASRRVPNETGGVLAGYWGNSDEVVVTAASVAGADAVHSPQSFKPDALYDEEWVARRYQKTKGEEVYLGDWHTHPHTCTPYLSRADRTTLLRIARAKEARAPNAVMIVCAGEQRDWTIKAWSVNWNVWWKLVGRPCIRSMTIKVFDS